MPRRAPPKLCDAPRCTVQVKRGILMCREHWFMLPRPLREAINDTWRARRFREWSANCLEARGYLAEKLGIAATGPAPPAHRISAQEAYARTQRLMGEN